MDKVEYIDNKKKKNKKDKNEDMTEEELMLWCFIMGSQ